MLLFLSASNVPALRISCPNYIAIPQLPQRNMIGPETRSTIQLRCCSSPITSTPLVLQILESRAGHLGNAEELHIIVRRMF